MKWYKSSIDVLEVKIAIGFPRNSDELAVEAIRLGDDPEYHNEYTCEGMYMFNTDDQTHYIFFNMEYVTEPMISHECFHTTHGILEYVGQVFDKDNHEIFARLQEYLHKKTNAHWDTERQIVRPPYVKPSKMPNAAAVLNRIAVRKSISKINIV